MYVCKQKGPDVTTSCLCSPVFSQICCESLTEHKGQRLLLGDAARLARSLADGLVQPPVPELAVLGAIPCHLASAYLHRT